MSDISTADIQKLASLSALPLSDEQVTALQTDIQNILGYVEQLSVADTAGVEPTYDVHGLHSVTRADAVIDYGVSQAELLQNAPEQDGGSIVVPRVLE
ncbi:MAG TPA: Asp-tRNA(Asn)/Glu-tRNA(Gln) amidotransferase subunit GatC [Candidatus Saccharimonadales bacterium]|jgi:aspartyl-tRNA(Asn)/glutamyl-tRNA(Gln) amidotransferase subunit C